MGEKAANLPYPLRLFHAVHSLGQQSANTDFHPRDIIEGLTKNLEGATYLSAQRFPNSSNCSPNRMSLSLNESCNFRPGCMILHTPLCRGTHRALLPLLGGHRLSCTSEATSPLAARDLLSRARRIRSKSSRGMRGNQP
jgi:hypothetical protein